MGKATILQNLGAGHYRVKVEFENAKVEARLTLIDQQITDLTAKLIELSTQKQAAKDQFNADMAALNAYINVTPPEDYIKNQQTINALTAAAYKSKSAYDVLFSAERKEKLKKTGIEKDKLYLSKYCPKDFETLAWCVAYNEDLAAEIKTIECDYLLERDPITNQIRNDTGIWLPPLGITHDSQLQHPMASGVHANWFNLAMYPAMQKFKGRYRIATIISLDKLNDTCVVAFDGYANIHEYTTRLVDDKPILPEIAQQNNEVSANVSYMTCNAGAFEVSDRVIVDLNLGVGTPTVIGFYDNPRQCPTSQQPRTIQGYCSAGNWVPSSEIDLPWYKDGGNEVLCPSDGEFIGFQRAKTYTQFAIRFESLYTPGFTLNSGPVVVSEPINYPNGAGIWMSGADAYINLVQFMKPWLPEILIDQRYWGAPELLDCPGLTLNGSVGASIGFLYLPVVAIADIVISVTETATGNVINFKSTNLITAAGSTNKIYCFFTEIL